jgi:hypothetical protein
MSKLNFSEVRVRSLEIAIAPELCWEADTKQWGEYSWPDPMCERTVKVRAGKLQQAPRECEFHGEHMPSYDMIIIPHKVKMGYNLGDRS